MGRAPCCDKANVKKGPWSPEEDLKLKEYIEKYGTGGNWISLPQKAGLRRCGKSCRLRWLNYLRPNIKHGEFSDDEDRIICTLFASIGSRWSIIAAQLPGRTDNDIKNYWNTKLKKKFMGMVAQSPSQRKLNHQSTLSSLFQPSPSLLSPSYKCSSHIYNYTSSSLEAPINMSSVPSRLLNSNTSMTLQHQESFGGVMQYHYPTKDSSSSLLMFGGGDQASCSSSDGSCNNQLSHGSGGDDLQMGHGSGGDDLQMGLGSYFYNGVEEDQKFMLSNGGGDVNGWSHDQKPNGMWGERSGGAPFDYGLEEIKQLISTNFLVDENMTEERVMYY